MFDAVLVANRGEIAVRIIRTLRRWGIVAIAVYSDVDTDAPHVRAADTALRLGPAPAAASYLHIGRVIAAAERAGAQAVHPGYGFLAENPGLATACAEAGLVFVGPPPEAMAAMADKAQARQIMTKAGVPVVPGTDTGDLDDDALLAAAHEIGLPVMVKPVAGGGGKGMVAVSDFADLPGAVLAARRQALAAFGDDRLMLERLIDRPRHIEVQVLADDHGKVIHLGERECSLQRRHQKIVEETPSPLLDRGTRARIGAAAVDAARACGYRGAGTVEFIVSNAAPDTFFFLEMNTRLQVEHAVTEEVTGLDLVEWQLRIAAGESLPWSQDGVRAHGHAIEARVYAEDPARGFLPAGGRVLLYEEPVGKDVRVDSGIASGSVVPAMYDPLLAKVIAHGVDRDHALRRLDLALSAMTVLGLPVNIGFVRRLLSDDDVRAGALDTGLVARRLDAWAEGAVPDHVLVAAAMTRLITLSPTKARSVFDLPGGWRLGEAAWTVLRFRTGEGERQRAGGRGSQGEGERQRAGGRGSQGEGQRAEVRVRGSAAAAEIIVGGGTASPARATLDGAHLLVEFGGQQRRYGVVDDGEVIWVAHQGATWALRHEERLQAARHTDGSGGPVLAPLPGTVVAVEATDGAAVSVGQVLVVVEAMKMEHQVVAPIDGVVTSITVRGGDKVEIDQTLLVIESEPHGSRPHEILDGPAPSGG